MMRLADISVSFSPTSDAALDRISLDLPDQQILCVLGPSGSGKSTLLRVIAGLQKPDQGTVWRDEIDLTDTPPHQRDIGLMFQDHALFTQRDVAGNIGFGLRIRKTSKRETQQRVTELLELVGLPGFGHRRIDTLSGGEQQRVALARALAPRPHLLMLDEPLGQLDRNLRERLVQELRELFVRHRTTVLAVTHDHDEAFTLADRIVVMRSGRIVQQGTPLEVWQRPASAWVARFLGFRNVAAITNSEHQGGSGCIEVQSPWGPILIPSATAGTTMLVRPSGVRLDPAGELGAVVINRSFRRDHVLVTLRPDRGPELEVAARITEAPDLGSSVRITFDPAEIMLLPE